MKDLLEVDPVVGPDPETTADEVLTLVGKAGAELELGHADLLVLLEGDVAADHVVKQDSQGPDGGGVTVVARASDPFGWSINSGSCNEEKKPLLQIF